MKPYIFILAGGRGERLWPLSTPTNSKPFLTLFEGKSLIEHTLQRVQGMTDSDRLFIVTTVALRPTVCRVLPDFPEAQILCEPQARNTAAAMALMCGLVRQRDPQAVAAVLPADHLIRDEHAFQVTLQTAYILAQNQKEIITIGIHPTRPATEYGYIACGESITTPIGKAHCGIGFTEKPVLATAQTYLKAGNFLWNAGIFIWQADVLETAFRTFAPDFLPLIMAPETAKQCYATLPTIAFDYAIMEKCTAFSVVCGSFDWDDVGSYAALARQIPADTDGNHISGNVRVYDSADCTLLSTEPGHLLITAGLNDILVVHTAETTLVCPITEAHRLTDWIPPELR